MPLVPHVTLTTLTNPSKWRGNRHGWHRIYGSEITSRTTLFQLQGELYIYGADFVRAGDGAHVMWTIQPTSLRGRVEGSGPLAIDTARRECDEAARNYAISILRTLGEPLPNAPKPRLKPDAISLQTISQRDLLRASRAHPGDEGIAREVARRAVLRAAPFDPVKRSR